MNPKDLYGRRKTPFSHIPATVVAEIGLCMLEGALKYGSHNYRETDVFATIYYDAALRHLTQWFEGEDIDPDSGLSHVTKAITSLVVLRDAQMQGTCTDDRPKGSTNKEWLRELNTKAAEINARLGECKKNHTITPSENTTNTPPPPPMRSK